MDPVARMFAELKERNPEVRVRYRMPDGQATEREMSLLGYRRWLAQAPSNGLTLERVEITKKGES